MSVETNKRIVLRTFEEVFNQGNIDLLDELIAETITLEQVNEGYDRMRAGEQARSVIVFDS